MQGAPFNEHSYHRLFCKGSDVPLPAQPGLVPLLSIIVRFWRSFSVVSRKFILSWWMGPACFVWWLCDIGRRCVWSRKWAVCVGWSDQAEVSATDSPSSSSPPFSTSTSSSSSLLILSSSSPPFSNSSPHCGHSRLLYHQGTQMRTLVALMVAPPGLGWYQICTSAIPFDTPVTGMA